MKEQRHEEGMGIFKGIVQWKIVLNKVLNDMWENFYGGHDNRKNCKLPPKRKIDKMSSEVAANHFSLQRIKLRHLFI